MREVLIGVVVMGAGTAHADDEPEGSVRAQAQRRDRDGPWLHLDADLLPPGLEAFDAARDGQTTTLELGPHTRAALEGSWWSANPDTREDGRPGAHDIPGQGWRAGVRLSHDLGPVTITATGSVNHVSSRYGEGTYTDVGVSIGRTFRLSRWMTGWISLGVGRRQWRGVKPPDGEADGSQVMLSIGTTFR